MPTTTSPVKCLRLVKCIRTYVPTGQKFVQVNTASDVVILSDVKVTAYDPNYKIKIAKHVDASLPYTKTGGKAYSARVSGTQLSDTERYDYYGFLTPPGSGSFDTSLKQDLKDLALTRLKRKLKSRIGQSSLQAPLAEAKELSGLIRQAASLGTNALNAMIDLKRSKGRSAAKYAADTWLGYSFGVRPLVNDINSVATSLQDYLDRDDHVLRVVGSATTDWKTGNNLSGSYTFSNYGNVLSADDIKHTLSYRYVGAMSLKVSSGNNYSRVDHLGLGVDKLPSTLWELTAFSWLVDYFTNVGQYLDDVFYSPPGDLIYLNLDTRYVGRGVRTFRPNSQGSTYQVGFNAGSAVTDYYSFRREILTTLPHIGLRVKSRDEIGIFAVNKLLNLAAILAK